MSKAPLNGLDWQLLELLQQDGRMTVSQLARRLRRSRSTIAEHLAKLQEAGVLRGVSAQVDEERLGFGLSAFVRLQASSSEHRRIINAVIALPEVAECHVLTGTDLLMMRLVARDMPHLRELVDRLTVYGATQTDVVFSTLKSQLLIDTSLRACSRHPG
jgi:Lrp/AsnC family leucine-responsive transcriptional regulator